MSNFGVRHLRVVNPYEVAFREARSAVGASEVLKNAQEYPAIADAVADCSLVIGTTTLRNRERQHPMHRLEEGVRRILKVLASRPTAILFGSEKVGLSNVDLSHCHWLMHIPTREEHPSMNLGQAVAVCLYEIARNEKSQATANQDKLASAGELERLTETLLKTLHESGYFDQGNATNELKIRRLVRRLNLQADDAELMLGMLRQILWKIGPTEK
jgi:TrmH family RNA methyltransferase